MSEHTVECDHCGRTVPFAQTSEGMCDQCPDDPISQCYGCGETHDVQQDGTEVPLVLTDGLCPECAIEIAEQP